MSDNVIFLDMDDDDDKTLLQTEEDLKRIRKDIVGFSEDDTTEVEITHKMAATNRPYWQKVFG
ncbi:MAG: hypothetical protein KAU21_09450 [Gammaproteobacteria bacterium]|nr:hypothetical protein [Gammaproteobacteria bacterium]